MPALLSGHRVTDADGDTAFLNRLQWVNGPVTRDHPSVRRGTLKDLMALQNPANKSTRAPQSGLDSLGFQSLPFDKNVNESFE